MDSGVPGWLALVLRRGQVVLAEAFGVRGPHGEPLDIDDRRGSRQQLGVGVVQGTDHDDGLVAHFLSFARNEASEKSSVRLADLVRDTAQLVAKEADRREITVVFGELPKTSTGKIQKYLLRERSGKLG